MKIFLLILYGIILNSIGISVIFQLHSTTKNYKIERIKTCNSQKLCVITSTS